MDNFLFAYPILQNYQVTWTVYIVSNFINKKSVPTEFVSQEIINSNSSISLKIGGNMYDFDLTVEKYKETCYQLLKNELKAVNTKEDFLDINESLKSIYVDTEFKLINENLFMSKQHLRELAKDALVTIGNHTKSHFRLEYLETRDAYKEVEEGFFQVKKIIGYCPVHFSYPYGSKNKTLISSLKDCPFVASAMATNNLGKQRINNVYSLPRTEIVGNITIY